MSQFKKHEVENITDWTEWIRPIRKGYKLACCDCGLVHDFDFRIRKEWRGLVVEFKARRNQRSTGQMRRAILRKINK